MAPEHRQEFKDQMEPPTTKKPPCIWPEFATEPALRYLLLETLMLHRLLLQLICKLFIVQVQVATCPVNIYH